MPTHETSWKDSLHRLGKAVKVPELRKRLVFIGGMLLLFVLGLHIPAPFVDPEKFQEIAKTGVFGFIDIISGGAFRRLSILALGIIPYINASIIMQLLGVAVPAIQRMQKEGESGRRTISMYTRWGTVAVAALQAGGLAYFLQFHGAMREVLPGPLEMLPLIVVMIAGTSFLMWMGEQLTDKGIGNGVSLIIFAGIMIQLPFTMGQIVEVAWAQASDNMAFGLMKVGLIVLVFLAIVVFITWVHQATRQIPIQHAKRVVGNRVYSSANTYLPLKVVTAGVIPIIFAISLVMLPATVAQMLKPSYPDAQWVDWLMWLSPGYHWLGAVIYFLLVVFFTYFYTAVVYNVQDIADNLKKHGSFVPGLRPGKQTEQYIDQVLTKLTFAGAIFLGVVALLPYIVPVILGGQGDVASLFPLWGGTSLLIVVGVALETMKQLEAHLVMRHYEGFIKQH